jgi:tetratricopeptide (TPR) repeat protein
LPKATLAAAIFALSAIAISAPRIGAQAAPAPSTAETAPASPPSSLTRQGLDALQANQPQQALDDFQHALEADPDNLAANLLAATAALSLYKGNLAVAYAEKARQLDPGNWKVHTTLVAAYAAAGKQAERDQERETLRKLHDDPHAPEAMQTSGFLLEMFPVRQYRVEAVEYFKPVGRFHVYYRFLLRNAEGRRIWQIDAESDDFDQKSWAQAHPDEAAAGRREFQLVGQSVGQNPGQDADLHVDYRMFSGLAEYDPIRAQVVKVIEEQGGPFPAESRN